MIKKLQAMHQELEGLNFNSFNETRQIIESLIKLHEAQSHLPPEDNAIIIQHSINQLEERMGRVRLYRAWINKIAA